MGALESGVPARKCGLHERRYGWTPQSLQEGARRVSTLTSLSLSPGAPVAQSAWKAKGSGMEALTGQPPGTQSKGGDGVKGRSESQLIRDELENPEGLFGPPSLKS